MRIIVDMQGAQSLANRNRGIGRYTLSIAKALVRNCGEHEILLVLSGLFPETIEPVRDAFSDLLPPENIQVWYAPGPVNYIEPRNDSARQSAELIREAFIASLNPSVVLVCSLFEGCVDNAITSICSFGRTTIPTAVILYDLIPLLNPVPYLENPAVAKWYESKLNYLKKAELLLSISESSRQEAIQHLGIPTDRVVNISTAADPQFRALQVEPEHEAALRERYGLSLACVMYTGGIDHRKNIEGLIRAYAALPAELRKAHQLAVVCSIHARDRARLEELADQCGLNPNEMVLTGYVPEEDLIALYNLCKIFIFPSWHEGFGLPALEAMSCRRAVIGSNTTSLPEVIGYEEALFDPFDDESITQKLKQVLTDDAFRQQLECRALEQAGKFSWDRSAQLAISAMEEIVGKSKKYDRVVSFERKPRLAFVSPLPSERSGISDYSAELLPALAAYYDIDVVVAQEIVADPWINLHCPVRSVQWFRDNADQFDRVVYHFGNSTFHQHMFALLAEIPGVVVLHDFFLSGIVAYMEYKKIEPGKWLNALYSGHGYAAVHERYHSVNNVDVLWKYPCNYDVLQGAQGIIVHSENSQRMARNWYGTQVAEDWRVIPLLRTPYKSDAENRSVVRGALGLNQDDFVVCSFGLIGPTKLNHRLLEAWLASPLSLDGKCVLIFVGEKDQTGYGDALQKTMEDSGLGARIKITGWADMDIFRQYLMAADVGVQLRTLSRGETSAAVLDCMNHGVATIVNANGSMADLSDDGVWKLPDEFDDAHLCNALVTLWQDVERRKKLGETAQRIIREDHNPAACAKQYFDAVESFQRKSETDINALIKQVGNIERQEKADVGVLAQAIALTIAPRVRTKQLLVDVSGLVQRRGKVKAFSPVVNVVRELLLSSQSVYRVEPVYVTREGGCLYARKFCLQFLGCPDKFLGDDPVECFAGDVFLGINGQLDAGVAQQEFFKMMRYQGVSINILDLFSGLALELQQYNQSIIHGISAIADSDLKALLSQILLDRLAGSLPWSVGRLSSEDDNYSSLRILRWTFELHVLNGLSRFSPPLPKKMTEKFSRSAERKARRLQRNRW